MAEENTEQTSEAASANESQEQVIGITLTAAKLVCEIITLCTKRGAFNPNELAVVGTLFNQLAAQIPTDQKPEEAPEASEEVEIEVTPEEEVQLELELEEATK